jgi:type I restriction enzyme, R subunit
VPIRYTFGPQEWFLDKDKLKKGYEEITAGLTEDEKRLVERRVQAWKVFLKHKDRIEVLAEAIAEDFRNVVEPQGYKAQLVACDKEACVLYYNELLKYFDSSELTIIFSTGNYDQADQYELLKDHYKENKERRRLIAKFKRRITPEERQEGNNLKILIVCNMLLTGFDAPIEQTMYLDSPLRDHNLLQAVARTNRPYDDKVSKLSKKFGRIVDYVGVFENYKEALSYYPEDIGEFEDVESLVLQFPKVLVKALEPFKDIKIQDSLDCAKAIVRKLSELDQSTFEQDYHEVLQLWEAISPHPGLKEYKKKYLWLNAIYEIYLDEFKRLDFDAEIYAVKTGRLIQESARLIKFKGHLPEITIDSNYLNELKETKLSPSDKAEKIIRDIETVIRKNEAHSAAYMEFHNRLDELIKRKQWKNEAVELILLELGALYTELDEIASLPQRMGFEDKGAFEIYMQIKNARVKDFNEKLSRKFAEELVESVIRKKIYIGWQDVTKEVERLRVETGLCALEDKYQSLKIDEDSELMDALMRSIVKNFGLK